MQQHMGHCPELRPTPWWRGLTNKPDVARRQRQVMQKQKTATKLWDLVLYCSWRGGLRESLRVNVLVVGNKSRWRLICGDGVSEIANANGPARDAMRNARLGKDLATLAKRERRARIGLPRIVRHLSQVLVAVIRVDDMWMAHHQLHSEMRPTNQTMPSLPLKQPLASRASLGLLSAPTPPPRAHPL